MAQHSHWSVLLQKPDSLGQERFRLGVPTGQAGQRLGSLGHRTRGPDLSRVMRGGEPTQGG